MSPFRDASIDSAAHRRGEGKARHTAVRSACLAARSNARPSRHKSMYFKDLRGFGLRRASRAGPRRAPARGPKYRKNP